MTIPTQDALADSVIEFLEPYDGMEPSDLFAKFPGTEAQRVVRARAAIDALRAPNQPREVLDAIANVRKQTSAGTVQVAVLRAALDDLEAKLTPASPPSPNQPVEAVAWRCGACGDGDVPEKFRVFGSCYKCAAQKSINKRDQKIERLTTASPVPAEDVRASVIAAMGPFVKAAKIIAARPQDYEDRVVMIGGLSEPADLHKRHFAELLRSLTGPAEDQVT